MQAYPSDSLLGSVVDRRYRVDERVGAGAFGCVYAAWHLALGVRVALKVLSLEADSSEVERGELVARFLNEAHVLTRLKHPNIVTALDLGTVSLEPGSVAIPYLVMEWCDGETLARFLAERSALSPADAYEIMEPLADALGHAHAAGVLHRDIKPSNVMLSTVQGRLSPRLIDFGIAKHTLPRGAAGSTESVTVGAPPYTAAYAAPEQVAGARTSPATDVHALGLLFVELLTGSPPYGAFADPALAIIDATRPSAGPGAGAFAGVIARAVALKADDRYADGRALRDALREAGRRELGAAHPIPSARPASRGRRPIAIAACSAALLVAGLVAIAVRQVRSPQTSATPVPRIAPIPFCALAEDEQRDRLSLTGLSTFGFAPGWALMGDEGDRIVTFEWRGDGSPFDTLIEAASDVSGVESLGIAYAVDRGCVLSARGPQAELERDLDAVLQGQPQALRGDTTGGSDPLAITQPKPTAWRGPPATSLRQLSPDEYVERTKSAGMLIHDANRSQKKNGDWYQLSVKQGGTRARLEYISGPYARAQLLAKLGKADEVVYYAIDEPVAILARGLPDASLLERMLSDLGALVEKSPP
jgi:hypothetical protein